MWGKGCGGEEGGREQERNNDIPVAIMIDIFSPAINPNINRVTH